MPNHADPTAQRHPAQHASRDHRQFKPLTNHRLPRGHPRRQNHPGQRTDHTVHGKDNDLGPINVHTREQRRFLITTDGHGVAPVGGVIQQPTKKQKANNGDQNRHRHAKQLAVTEDEE
ncbi:hypothetical protein D3C81_1613630 [compost metagenome]